MAEIKPDTSRLQTRGLNITPACSLYPPVIRPYAFRYFVVTFSFVKQFTPFSLEEFDLVSINMRCCSFQERVCCQLGVLCVERDVCLHTDAA